MKSLITRGFDLRRTAEVGGTSGCSLPVRRERTSLENAVSTPSQDETSIAAPDDTGVAAPDGTAVAAPDDTAPVPVSAPGPENPETGEAASAVVHIGKYEVRGLLGRGGMGCVHRAFDPVLEREVALKVMRAEIVGDPEQKQRFEREARAVARLSHPGVVTVFDLGYHTDGSPYIVMELLRGQDLLARMRAEPPLSLEEKVSIVGQILDGLGHAHRTGIVHRDIKPANVFLTEEGSARIMDFGLAFFTSSGATSQSIMGTVSYMSTEQVRGERLDGRSDLFSVGTMLCEMLTGRRPFDAETPAATLYRIVHDEPQIDLPSGREQPVPAHPEASARQEGRRAVPDRRRVRDGTAGVPRFRARVRRRPRHRLAVARRVRLAARPVARPRFPVPREQPEVGSQRPLQAASRGLRRGEDRAAPLHDGWPAQEPPDPEGKDPARHERRERRAPRRRPRAVRPARPVRSGARGRSGAR